MSKLAKPLTEDQEPPILWAIIALIAGIAALFAASSISNNAARWHTAETALNHWNPSNGKIDKVQRSERRRFPQKHTRTRYIDISGTYLFAGSTHRFETDSFEESEIQRATRRYYFSPGEAASVHVNPAKPAESVFEAKAQLEIYRPKTTNARFLATSGCGLCLISGVLQYLDRRRFHRKARS